MLRTEKILGALAENGMTRKELAMELDMAPKTFYAKMKRRQFESNELETIVKILKIENPWETLFGVPEV